MQYRPYVVRVRHVQNKQSTIQASLILDTQILTLFLQSWGRPQICIPSHCLQIQWKNNEFEQNRDLYTKTPSFFAGYESWEGT